MSVNDRIRVIWVGRQIPEQLQEVVKILGLTVEEVRDVTRIDIRTADLLAVIVSAVGEDAAKAEGRLLQLATLNILDYGVLLGVASLDPSDAFRLQSVVLRKAKINISALGLTSEYFADKLRSHKAGPAASPNLASRISGHNQEDYGEHHRDDYESDAILLQRAFDGFNKLILTSQEGGRSRDCKVWKIEASCDSGACEPFVAKAARRGDLESEFETYRAFVRDSIPFPFRAPVLEGRFIKGAKRAILVSAFVGRSQRLDDYLATASNPELVMVSLFEGALGKWRRGAKRVRGAIGQAYVSQQRAAKVSNPPDVLANSLLPNPEGLMAAFANAAKLDDSLLNPSQIWDLLDRLPETDYFIARVHGDLNVRNVFVRWNSIDTILIDFSHSGIVESLARDPAKLETSIALNVGDRKGGLLTASILRKLYRSPLVPPRDFITLDSRTDAIYQIRRHVGGEGISSYEYEILCACHLLRFACEPGDKTNDSKKKEDRRALSYALACNLLVKWEQKDNQKTLR